MMTELPIRSLGTRNKWLISQWTRLYDPCDCILARGRVCVGTILEKSGEIKTAKFQVSLRAFVFFLFAFASAPTFEGERFLARVRPPKTSQCKPRK